LWSLDTSADGASRAVRWGAGAACADCVEPPIELLWGEVPVGDPPDVGVGVGELAGDRAWRGAVGVALAVALVGSGAARWVGELARRRLDRALPAETCHGISAVAEGLERGPGDAWVAVGVTGMPDLLAGLIGEVVGRTELSLDVAVRVVGTVACALDNRLDRCPCVRRLAVGTLGERQVEHDLAEHLDAVLAELPPPTAGPVRPAAEPEPLVKPEPEAAGPSLVPEPAERGAAVGSEPPQAAGLAAEAVGPSRVVEPVASVVSEPPQAPGLAGWDVAGPSQVPEAVEPAESEPVRAPGMAEREVAGSSRGAEPVESEPSWATGSAEWEAAGLSRESESDEVVVPAWMERVEREVPAWVAPVEQAMTPWPDPAEPASRDEPPGPFR